MHCISLGITQLWLLASNSISGGQGTRLASVPADAQAQRRHEAVRRLRNLRVQQVANS